MRTPLPRLFGMLVGATAALFLATSAVCLVQAEPPSDPAVDDSPRQAASGANSAPPRPPSESPPTVEARIEAALDKVVKLQFIDTPLVDVADYLREATQVPIGIDRRSLEDVGIASDTPITWTSNRITLRSVLRLMLAEHDLTTYVRDESLVITIPEEVQYFLVTKAYAAGDLAWKRTRSGARVVDHDRLGQVIVKTIDPTAWDSVGGPGAILGHGETLAVSTTADIHRKVERLLSRLHGLPRLDGKDPAARFDPAPIPLRPAAPQLHAALRSKVDGEFIETPLADVVAYLSDVVDAPIHLDRRALDAVGISTDVAITAKFKQRTLAAALSQLLRQLDLCYVAQDEVLLVTTPEEAEHRLSVVLYPVADLLKVSAETPTFEAEAQLYDLAVLAQRIVQVTSWDQVGGVGACQFEPTRGVLVVANTDDCQQEVAAFLARLRAARQSEGASPPPEESDVRPTRTHRLTDEAAALDRRELVELIRNVVAPDSWEDGSIEVLAGHLVVKQRPMVHAQVNAFLDKHRWRLPSRMLMDSESGLGRALKKDWGEFGGSSDEPSDTDEQNPFGERATGGGFFNLP